MPKQSARFGVSLMTKTLSSRSRYVRMSAPTGASGGSASRPPWSSDKPSSRAEHSMPLLSTPRSLARLMSMPGRCAPTVAQGTFMPAATFGAPHTICSGSPPAFTLHTRNRSASGCGATESTWATTTPSNTAAAAFSSSTSRPAIVSRCDKACVSMDGSTNSRNHFSENFISVDPQRNWLRKRTSPS
jgi:hypothetical protein